MLRVELQGMTSMTAQSFTFCPMAVAWGDVATWVSGLASFLAVAVALWIARYSAREAARREAETKRHAAQAMAVALHGELVPLVGLLKGFQAIRRQYGEDFSARDFDQLRFGVSRLVTPALDRFLERLDVFSPQVAGQLMIVYRGVLSMQDAVKTPEIDYAAMTDVRARTALQSVSEMAAATERWIYAALDSLSALAGGAGFTVMSTEEVRAQADSLVGE
jgi:hypothetical protein